MSIKLVPLSSYGVNGVDVVC